MYIPGHFAGEDEAAIGLMREHPFGLVVTVGNGEPFISHVPFLLAEDGARVAFHLARANPQCMELQAAGRATLVFQGPHAYVSPRWYADPNVPTWNYAAVHVRGPVRALDERGTAALVAAFSRAYEGPAGLGEFEHSASYAALLRGIIGFELSVEQRSAKFKLSQNRKPADRASVMAQLAADPRTEVQATAALMRGIEPSL